MYQLKANYNKFNLTNCLHRSSLIFLLGVLLITFFELPLTVLAANDTDGSTAETIGVGSDNNVVNGLQNTLGDSNYNNAVSGRENTLGDFNSANTVSGELNTLGNDNYYNAVSGFSNTLGNNSYFNAISGFTNTLDVFSNANIVSGDSNTLGNDSDYNTVSGRNNDVNGDDHFVTGNGNTVTGTGNFAAMGATVSGSNNIGMGSEATSSGIDTVAIGNESSATAAGSVAIGQGSVADQDNTVSIGSSGNERRITNIADAINDSDAVSLRQMTTMADTFNSDISGLTNRVDELDERLDDVGALGAALSALVPGTRSNGNTQVSVGLGAYRGSQAIAAGLFHYVNDNVMVNTGISTTTNNKVVARAGITFGW